MIRNASAMLPVADIPAACDFIRDCLGFKVFMHGDNHAYCEHGQGAVRFIQAPPDADMDDPARQIVIYLDCDDADAHWAAHETAIMQLPESHRDAPTDRDYGMRDFHLIYGPFLFMVGHPLKAKSP